VYFSRQTECYASAYLSGSANRRYGVHGRPASNDSLDYERIGRFIYAFHGICGSVDALTDTELAANAPPPLVQRAARVAQKYRHITSNFASTAEGELESTLREVTEVQSGIDEWRSRGCRR
jgi:hypothetical protein